MLFKTGIFFVGAILAVFVSATPPSSCSTGPVQCCNDVHKINPDESKGILKLFNVDVPVGTDVGFTCSPITGIGLGSGSGCQSNVVCCENNNFNGVIAVGCSPVNLNI